MADEENNVTISGANIFTINESDSELTDIFDGDFSDIDPDYLPDSDLTFNKQDSNKENDIRGNSDLLNTDNNQEKIANRTKQCKKRKRNESKQAESKRLKNTGMQYKKYRGKGSFVHEKIQGEPCNCPRKCYNLFTLDQRENIFNSFWNLSNFNTQNAYLQGCMTAKSIARKKTKAENSRRTQSIYYNLPLDGKKIRVCKTAFLNIHGLQKHRGRVENITKLLKNGCSTPVLDNRGKHLNHPKKYSENDVIFIKTFINKLPRYKSHYTRKNTSREFMSMDYSVQLCYEKYQEECVRNNRMPVSADKFRRIFTEDFNISFKTPKADTCADCDAFNISIKNEEAKKNTDGEILRQIKIQQELHHRKAEAARRLMQDACEEAQMNEKIHAITFDLQQTLPTPKLTTGPTFYKRKLSSYNFNVHSLSNDQGYFFLWDEATAKRGADEIASCLKLYFEENDIRGDKLIAFSDNCGGQNKNWTIIAFWLYLLESERFKEIIHIFPQVGHTMLPSDRDFARVENYVKKCEMVYSPDHWEDILRKSQKKKPFIVRRVEQKDFMEFSELKKIFNQSKITLSKNMFRFRSCVKFVFSANDTTMFRISTTYSGPLEEVSLLKRGRPSNTNLMNIHLKRKYDGPLPIPKEKLKDVLSCLEWIPSFYHQYYKNLKSE